jgi:hypothetical protein
MTIIGSLLVLAIGVVLLCFSLDTKVLTVLALVFAVPFIGLFSPSLINSWLLAARLGIAAVIAIWLVVWLLHVRRTGSLVLAQAGPGAGAPAADAHGGTAGSNEVAAAKIADGPDGTTGKRESDSHEQR